MSEKKKDPEEPVESHSYYIDLRIKKIEKACDQIVQQAYALRHLVKGSADTIPQDELDALFDKLMQDT